MIENTESIYFFLLFFLVLLIYFEIRSASETGFLENLIGGVTQPFRQKTEKLCIQIDNTETADLPLIFRRPILKYVHTLIIRPRDRQSATLWAGKRREASVLRVLPPVCMEISRTWQMVCDPGIGGSCFRFKARALMTSSLVDSEVAN